MTSTRAHIQVGTSARSCTDHGPYVAKVWRRDPPVTNPRKELQPWLNDYTDNCPTCNAAWQDEADQHDADIKGGTSEKQRRAMLRFSEAGILKRNEHMTLWNWQHGSPAQDVVFQWAREYVQHLDLVLQSGRCGIFVGPKGSGKTHCAVGILRHIIEKGGTGYYTSVMDMLGRIKDTYNPKATETEKQVVEHYVRVDLLVCDEVGKNLDTNYEQAQFFRVLDLRYRHMKPTILISNMPGMELAKFLGDPIMDRMRESGGRVLVFDWGSYRSSKRPPSKDGDS